MIAYIYIFTFICVSTYYVLSWPQVCVCLVGGHFGGTERSPPTTTWRIGERRAAVSVQLLGSHPSGVLAKMAYGIMMYLWWFIMITIILISSLLSCFPTVPWYRWDALEWTSLPCEAPAYMSLREEYEILKCALVFPLLKPWDQQRIRKHEDQQVCEWKFGVRKDFEFASCYTRWVWGDHNAFADASSGQKPRQIQNVKWMPALFSSIADFTRSI